MRNLRVGNYQKNHETTSSQVPRLYRGLAYLLRDEKGTVEVTHDRHCMGLFPKTVWLELIVAAGFEPLAVPFRHSAHSGAGREVFLGLRLVADGGA